jgi:nicotinate-nucleotide pyrophosphorylase (carboxylating)
MKNMLRADIISSIKRALEEDIGSGDVTTEAVVPSKAIMSGQIIAKQDGVVAGLDVVQATFFILSEETEFVAHVDEGAVVENQRVVAGISGPARALLTGERVALNLLGRMSGIATLARRFMDAVSGTDCVIMDTRKTAPGLRVLDKLAVQRGGAQNHRMGLYDMILIKDNHIDFAGSLEEAVRRARDAGSGLEIEVEARTLDDVSKALALGVKRIMLDNMMLDDMRRAVELCGRRAELEASGNVRLENVRQIAETGVHYISVGALTHSPRVFDVSMDWIDGDNKE